MGWNPYNPYQYPYQPLQNTQQLQNPQQLQNKYVEAIPVDAEAEAENCPMAAGSSGVFFARNDSFIAVKSVGVNGQISFSVYDKRPPAPVKPPIDMTAYVTKEEFESRLAAINAPRKAKKEAEE